VNQKIPATTTLLVPLARFRSLLIALALAPLCLAPTASLAAPEGPASMHRAAPAQNVDYIGADSGAVLDLEFPVLVPGWVPAPFGGSPSIDAGSGHYSLYWMNSGGEPTFLQVTGQIGGGLPAGSPFDLNVELFINASVQGYGAIHDVTPAYDAVWWIAGGVLYKVESRNSGTDSLTLANSLIAFVPPVVQEPTSPPPEATLPLPEPTSAPLPEATSPSQPPVVSEPSSASDSGSNSGGSTTSPESPAGETVQSPSSEESETSQPSQTSPATQSPDAPEDSSSSSAPSSTTSQEALELVPTESDGTGNPAVTSDGTGGAEVMVIGGDGTGGTNVVMIPLPAETQTP